MKNETLFWLVVLYVTFGVIVSCGDETYYSNDPSPKSEPLSNEIRTLLTAKCVSCHSGESFLIDKQLYQTKAIPLIKSNKMPPSGDLSDSEKSTLLSL